MHATPQDRETLIALFHQGRYAEAERLALTLTETCPQDSFGWKVLGVLYRHLGRRDAALTMMERAAVLSPHDAEPHSNLGLFLWELGRLAEAEARCRHALALRPDYAEAHNNLGVVLQAQGRNADAQASYRQALAFKTDYAEALNNLGQLENESGQFAPAEAHCRHALALRPDYAAAHNNLGVALQGLGMLEEAQASYGRALSLQPAYAQAHNNLGTVFKALARLDDAHRCYQRALELKPDFADAHYNLGLYHAALEQHAAAQASYQRALQLDPDRADAYQALADALRALGHIALAEANCRRALQLKPDFADAYNNLGLILVEQGRLAEALTCYARALSLEPDNTLFHSNLLCALNFTADGIGAGEDDGAGARLDAARRFGQAARRAVKRRYQDWPGAITASTTAPARLRVGLVSSDLRNHPVGYFLESVLPFIDTQRVELIAYASHRQDDALSARIRPHFSIWRASAGLSDEALAQRIHDDGVHILLDLAGHTAHNRLPVFAWKPAPVQVSWLGYFATTGLAEMDYLLADPVGVPPEHRGQFSEQIWYLPHTRLCFSAPQDAPAVTPLPASIKQHLTFASFQNLAKLTDRVLALWSRVLTAVPDARLRLQNQALADSLVREAFVQRLRQHHIDPLRVEMPGPMSRHDYLATHAAVDLILDTFPYPGGTTTCEALWMGVPTLTLTGRTLLARQGASLLTAAGLPDWITSNEDDYVQLAASWARNLSGLATLRAGLREQVGRSPLFDAAAFGGTLTQTLWDIWGAHQKSA